MKNLHLLLLLADKLQVMKPEKFGMGSWMAAYHRLRGRAYRSENYRVPAFKYIDESKEIIEPLDCKTAGCAMGWAATMPEFQALGLCLIKERENTADIALIRDGHFVDTGLDAIMTLFEMDYDDAKYLFWPGNYAEQDGDPTPQYVAERIRTFVRENQSVENQS